MIRVSVDLVQVDATVTDAGGLHGVDLKPADLEALEDGKPRKIIHLSYVPGIPTGVASARFAPARGAGQPAERKLAPAKAPRPEQVIARL